jgi:hypothetical protein
VKSSSTIRTVAGAGQTFWKNDNELLRITGEKKKGQGMT